MSRVQEIQQNILVGNFNEALKACSEAIADDPADADAFHLAGIVYMRVQQGDEAIKLLKRAIELRESSAFCYNLGVAYAQMEEYQEALQWYSKTLELNPGNVSAWNNKGAILQEMNELDEALACWQHALQLNPQMKVLLNNIGTIYLEKNDLAKALDFFKQALSLQENDRLLHKDWQTCRYDELDELGAWFDARERDGGDAGNDADLLGASFMALMRSLGNRYNQMGHGRKALEWYVRAIKYKKHPFRSSENRTNCNRWFAEAGSGLHGKILSAGSGEDYDKEGRLYRQYFPRADVYYTLDYEAKNQPDVVGNLCDMHEHFSDRSFDGIFSAWALEHVQNVREAVAEFHRVLKPGGWFLFGLPCNMAYHSFPHDYCRFTSDGIKSILDGFFDIIEMHQTGSKQPFVLDERLTLVGVPEQFAPPGYMGLCRRID